MYYSIDMLRHMGIRVHTDTLPVVELLPPSVLDRATIGCNEAESRDRRRAPWIKLSWIVRDWERKIINNATCACHLASWCHSKRVDGDRCCYGYCDAAAAAAIEITINSIDQAIN